MADRLSVLKCERCDVLIEVLDESDCDCGLACGDDKVALLEANTTDAAGEKHVPVIEKTDCGVKVKVGSVAHPMEEGHYIQWIQVISGDRACRVFLHPGDAPEAEFCADGDCVTAREYCNLHGLWEATT